MTITDAQRQALGRGEPVRIEDAESGSAYVLISEEVYRRLSEMVSDAYPAIDESFREGWEAPGMADYDDYESRRP